MTKKGATGDSFFSFLQKKDKNGQYEKKNVKEKKIVATRLAIISATRWTGNTLFFMDSLRGPACPHHFLFAVLSVE